MRVPCIWFTFFGLPRGRSVDSIISCFAASAVQIVLPNGTPRRSEQQLILASDAYLLHIPF
jgi:hypothetical protein